MLITIIIIIIIIRRRRGRIIRIIILIITIIIIISIIRIIIIITIIINNNDNNNNNSWMNALNSILGMNLFGCKFCESNKVTGRKQCWRKNFDSLLWATITVFQVMIDVW